MRDKIVIPVLWLYAAFVLTFACAISASAQTERSIFSFPESGMDGASPSSDLIADSAGRLYGTSTFGGKVGWYGTVFEMTAPIHGARQFRLLYSFTGLSDGRYPSGNMAMDAAGNLYGTASEGGANGDGVVYKLSRGAGGVWTQTVLHAFGLPGDGIHPSGLIIDSAGNLYGTTAVGGSGTSPGGTVYRLTPDSDGNWTETVLHTFAVGEGQWPRALVADGTGKLFGTTSLRGRSGNGSVYELSPTASGDWTLTVLYYFPGGKFLSTPNGSIGLDAAGNLFGTTAGGQVNPGFGAVYEVSPNPDGTWTETTLHLFGHPSDGQWPVGVTLHDGSLFGATSYGGAFGGTNGFGTVFQMKRSPNGQWSYQTIYSFTDGADGAWPNTGVTVGKGKAIYGTTNGGGGTGKNGVVFQLTF